MKKVKISVLLILLLTGCGKVKEEKHREDINNYEESNIEEKELYSEEELEIYIVTDIHYLSNEINDYGEAFEVMVNSSDGRQIQYVEEIVESLKSDIINSKPDILLVSGDLTHNGEKESHLTLAEKFKEIEESGTEVFVVPGNHDINNPWARGFKEESQYVVEGVTESEFESIYGNFGYNEAKYKDTNSLSYVATPNENLWLLMIDSNKYKNNVNRPETSGVINKDTLKWINEIGKIAKENNAEILAVTHHNLYNHSELLNKGFTVDNSEEVVEVFKNNNIKLNLSGHVHIQDIKCDDEEKVYDIVTSSLLLSSVQYGVIEYLDNNYNYYTKEVDVEKWAKENNIQDNNLLNFNKYKEEYFYNNSYNHVYDSLSKDKYSEEEINDMAKVMATLNLAYFNGTTALIKEEIVNTQGYKLWEKADNSFLKSYVISMAEDSDKDNNKWSLKNSK